MTEQCSTAEIEQSCPVLAIMLNTTIYYHWKHQA